MEKRSRKRSRKVSESEQVTEESSPPPIKTRRRSNVGRLSQAEEKRGRGGTRSRRKGLKVSFDIVENNLSVGEPEIASPCTLTLAEITPPVAPENVSRRGSGAGPREMNAPRKPIDIKFRKNSNFTFSYLLNNKKRSWRNYKQIVTAERALPWKPSDPTFSSLDAPPPLKPAKKYSDISGHCAKYRDPQSGLLYASSEEFRNIRSLPSDIITGYLALRGKLPIM